MILKKYFLIFALLISYSSAQEKNLTSAYDFLKLESSSRAASLGGSFVTFINDPNTIFYNPASISYSEGKQASFGFLKHLLDVNSLYASYTQQLDMLDGYVGAGIQYMGYGDFDQMDEAGNLIGSFSVKDIALLLSYARKSEDNFSYGANIKLIYSSIENYSSVGLGFDVGVLYRIPDQMINIGGCISNMGTQLSTYNGTRESFPLEMKVGISKTLEHLPLNININFHNLLDSYSNLFDRLKAFSIGGEFTLSKNLKFRVGYNNSRRTNSTIESSSGLAGFSLGLGLNIEKYIFDYSFSSYGKIGGLHRINLSTNF